MILAATLPLGAGESGVRSSDGRWLLRADDSGRTLAIVELRSGAVVERIGVADRSGVPARVARIVEALPRHSFIVTLHDVAEAWELVYAAGAEPSFDGLVHDYRMGEAIAQRHVWPLRRIRLEEPQQEFLFSPDFAHGIARARDGRLDVVNLHVRRRIETLAIDGDPVVAAGVGWSEASGLYFALPDSRLPVVHVIDARRWRVGRVELSGGPVSLQPDGAHVHGSAGGASRRWPLDELRRAAGF